MTRTSKQEERRARSPRKPKVSGVKTGPKKDKLKKGYKEHSNAIMSDLKTNVFIPKIK